jgi:hypothetical protein
MQVSQDIENPLIVSGRAALCYMRANLHNRLPVVGHRVHDVPFQLIN